MPSRFLPILLSSIAFATVVACGGTGQGGDSFGEGPDGGDVLADADVNATDGDGRIDGDGGGTDADAGITRDGGLNGDGGGSGGDGRLDGGDGGAGDQGDAGTSASSPCETVPGHALWRLRLPDNAGGYATLEAWDNCCDYSLADQACSLSGEPHDEAIFGPGFVFNSSTDFLRVRFSASGLNFNEATLYLSAHAEGSGIPNAVLESPLYGGLTFAPSVPISTHRTYAVDWTDFLSSNDAPSLTAVTLRSNPIGLAVTMMELCVE